MYVDTKDVAEVALQTSDTQLSVVLFRSAWQAIAVNHPNGARNKAKREAHDTVCPDYIGWQMYLLLLASVLRRLVLLEESISKEHLLLLT